MIAARSFVKPCQHPSPLRCLAEVFDMLRCCAVCALPVPRQRVSFSAPQIMEAEQVSARQLLQLVCGMSRVIAAADHPQRVAWQAHGAIGAACSAMMECLDSAEDEVGPHHCF